MNKKLQIASAVVWLVAALLLVLLFTFNLTFLDLSPDGDKTANEQLGDAIGAVLLLILGLPASIAWLVAAVGFVVVGILQLTKPNSTKKRFTVLLIVAFVALPIAVAGGVFLGGIYTTYHSPLIWLMLLAFAAYAAGIVLAFIVRKSAPKTIAPTV